ncbi:MAG: hypothetical protein ABF243_09835 [Celeribacter marinus]
MSLSKTVTAQTIDTDHDHSEASISPKGVALTLLFIVACLAAVGFGVVAFGPWVLGLTALAFVPVIYIVLILLTIGK